MKEMQEIMEDISNTLLERMKNEKEKGALDGKEEKSIIGVLGKFFEADEHISSYIHTVPSQGQRNGWCPLFDTRRSYSPSKKIIEP